MAREMDQAVGILASSLRSLGIAPADAQKRARATLSSIGTVTQLAVAAAVKQERAACVEICRAYSKRLEDLSAERTREGHVDLSHEYAERAIAGADLADDIEARGEVPRG